MSGGTTYTYNKTHTMVAAAALLNLELTDGGWFQITDYQGNSIRFHCERNCPNGGTLTGDVQALDGATHSGTYRAAAGHSAVTDIVMIDPQESGLTDKWGTNIAQVINGSNGFGQFGGTVIALSYNDGFGLNPSLADFNFNYTAYSITSWDVGTICTHLEHLSTSQPAGNGFTNTDLNSGVSSRKKVLLIQNNPRKVNNTVSNQRIYNGAGYDGNLPITYGQDSNGHLVYTGENPTSFVGGKFEQIKAHFPLRSQDGFITNIAGPQQAAQLVLGNGTIPSAAYNSGVAFNEYGDPGNYSRVITTTNNVSHPENLNGAMWSSMSPDD